MFKYLIEKRKLHNRIKEFKRSTAPSFDPLAKYCLVLIVNKYAPEDDQKLHISQAISMWLFDNYYKNTTQTWYNQKYTKEENIIIYKFDTEQLKNIMNIRREKHVTKIGEDIISICLGLMKKEEIAFFNYERVE